MNIALVVEGDGDHRAFPTLIAKTGQILGDHYVVGRPIIGGTAEKLARPGKLEAVLQLAASRPGADLILVAVDLDDGCPVDYQSQFRDRAEAISGALKGVPVRFAFCIREYEAWFVFNIESLRVAAPEFDWKAGWACEDPSVKRNAKGLLREAMARHYKPSVHQLRLTQCVDLKSLFAQSRAYRKLVKSLAGVDYELLEGYFA
jgi:hypothetical protein